jgi:hypothetical protein
MFGKKKRLAIAAKVPTVSVADILAKLHWCEKHIIAMESRELERFVALSSKPEAKL